MNKSISVFLFSVLLIFTCCLSESYAQNQSDSTPNSSYVFRMDSYRNLLKMGNVSAAFDTLTAVINDYPKAHEAYFAKALIAAQMRDMDGAVFFAKKAASVQEKPEYLRFLIDVYKRMNKPDSAFNYLDRLMNQDDAVELKRERIITLYMMGDMDLAYDYFKEVQSNYQSTDSLDVLGAMILNHLKRYKESQKLLLPYLQSASSNVQVYMQLATAYVGDKQNKKAEEVLNAGLQRTKNGQLYFELADMHRNDSKSTVSFEFLKKGFADSGVDFGEKYRIFNLLLNPQYRYSLSEKLELANVLVQAYPRVPESHLIKGQVLWMLKKYDEAQSEFLIAVGINPYAVEGWRMLMSVNYDNGQTDAGINYGTEALKSNRNNATLQYFQSVGYILKQDWKMARSTMEAALNNSERESPFLQSEIYSGLGDIYYREKMEKVSFAAYREAIRLDSTNVSAMNNLAYYLSLKKESLEEAETLASKVVVLNPDVGTYQDTYAWVLFQQGKYQEALIWAKNAIKNTDSPDGVYYEHLGDIQAKLGNITEAIKQWKTALVKSSGDVEKNEVLKRKINEKKYVE